MGLLPTPISSAGRPSARAHLWVLLAGAAPARSAMMIPTKSVPAAARFDRGCGGHGEQGGGGARIAGAGISTSLRRPAAPGPALKISPFPSSSGASVLCLSRRGNGVHHGYGGDDGVAGGDRANKGVTFCHGKGGEGAPPAGGVGGDGRGYTGGAGAGEDADKAAAAGAGGGGGHCADQGLW
ncbi:unnamed protein product [Urochloa humidicola]